MGAVVQDIDGPFSELHDMYVGVGCSGVAYWDVQFVGGYDVQHGTAILPLELVTDGNNLDRVQVFRAPLLHLIDSLEPRVFSRAVISWPLWNLWFR